MKLKSKLKSDKKGQKWSKKDALGVNFGMSREGEKNIFGRGRGFGFRTDMQTPGRRKLTGLPSFLFTSG